MGLVYTSHSHSWVLCFHCNLLQSRQWIRPFPFTALVDHTSPSLGFCNPTVWLSNPVNGLGHSRSRLWSTTHPHPWVYISHYVIRQFPVMGLVNPTHEILISHHQYLGFATFPQLQLNPLMGLKANSHSGKPGMMGNKQNPWCSQGWVFGIFSCATYVRSNGMPCARSWYYLTDQTSPSLV